MSHKPPILLPAQEQPIAHGNDKQAPIRQEAQAHWSARDASDDFLFAFQIDSNNFLCAEVGEPEAAIVPTWRLAEHETGHQGVQFSQVKTPYISVLFHDAEREMSGSRGLKRADVLQVDR